MIIFTRWEMLILILLAFLLKKCTNKERVQTMLYLRKSDAPYTEESMDLVEINDPATKCDDAAFCLLILDVEGKCRFPLLRLFWSC